MKLNRPLTWDATAERFVNDDEANGMLTRAERALGCRRELSGLASCGGVDRHCAAQREPPFGQAPRFA